MHIYDINRLLDWLCFSSSFFRLASSPSSFSYSFVYKNCLILFLFPFFRKQILSSLRKFAYISNEQCENFCDCDYACANEFVVGFKANTNININNSKHRERVRQNTTEKHGKFTGAVHINDKSGKFNAITPSKKEEIK